MCLSSLTLLTKLLLHGFCLRKWGRFSRKGTVTLWLILEGRSRVEAPRNDTLSPSNPVFSPNHLTPSSSMDSNKVNL